MYANGGRRFGKCFHLLLIVVPAVGVPFIYAHNRCLFWKSYNMGFEVLTPVGMKISIFWDITPCSLLKVNRRYGETSPPSSGSNKPSKIPPHSASQLLLRSSETSVHFHQTTRRYIPEDITLHVNTLCELMRCEIVWQRQVFFFHWLYSPLGPWPLIFSSWSSYRR
jgi:hypothetical protein